MEAKARSFTFMGNEGIIKIPFFQRGYIWKIENWDELLLDLSNNNKNHFLGSIILKQQRAASGEPKEVLVIDGQQRLTTLSILIKALYDSFSTGTKENSKIAVRNYLFFRKNQTDKDYLIKIQHSQIDSESYGKVIRSGIDDNKVLSIPKENPNRIFGCYSYFFDELAKKSIAERESLFNAILNEENKILVVIDLDEKDEEQAIFDTINSAGVRLSHADTIKNALFQRVIQLENISDATKLYENTWKKVFLSDDETIAFWEEERLTGRLKRNNIEILLHSIAVIKGFYDPDKHTLSELPKLYKEQISNYSETENLKKFVEEIKDYANIFRDKILIFDKTTLFSFNNYQQRLFHILDALEISTFHPFILYLFKRFSNDNDRIQRMFSLLERFVIRRVISKNETKSFNKLCKEFIKDSDILNEKLSENNDNDFVRGLKKISNKYAALLLFWVELNRRANDNKFEMKELKYNYSLEHIMPQKWEQDWKDMPVKRNPDGSIMQSENSKADRYEKIYWIGNMTLLTSSLNTSLRNYEFNKKMEGVERKWGIKKYADLSITRMDIVEPYDNGDKIWDENKIMTRTEALIGEINSIWNRDEIEKRSSVMVDTTFETSSNSGTTPIQVIKPVVEKKQPERIPAINDNISPIRAPIISIYDLIKYGKLKVGDKLIFCNRGGKMQYPKEYVIVEGDGLRYSDGKLYSSSNLARDLRKKLFLTENKKPTQGPIFWITESGKLLDSLNNEVREEKKSKETNYEFESKKEMVEPPEAIFEDKNDIAKDMDIEKPISSHTEETKSEEKHLRMVEQQRKAQDKTR